MKIMNKFQSFALIITHILFLIIIIFLQLVGHIIKGGGTAISGQEQSLLYKKDEAQPSISMRYRVLYYCF